MMNINTKPRISQERKNEILEYLKTSNVHATAKRFKVGYNTINFWINPKYKEYTLKKTYENYDKILAHSKRYALERRQQDKDYVNNRNENAKQWQKNKRRTDPNWRDKNSDIAKKYYESIKHTEHHKEIRRKFVRTRRARKLKVNERYTTLDEKYTKLLFNNECAICKSTEKLCIDHWYPLDKGYALSRTNAVLLCRKCNRNKSNYFPNECLPIETVNLIENKLKSIVVNMLKYIISLKSEVLMN